MITVWIFLIVINGYVKEVGNFSTQEECENTRKEIMMQRREIDNALSFGKEYQLNKYNETSKCFKVLK